MSALEGFIRGFRASLSDDHWECRKCCALVGSQCICETPEAGR